MVLQTVEEDAHKTKKLQSKTTSQQKDTIPRRVKNCDPLYVCSM